MSKYNLKRSLLNVEEHIWADKLAVSVGDIMLSRAIVNIQQLLVCSRLLDIENYIEHGDDSFIFQNTISRSRYGSSFSEEVYTKAFISLINSFQDDGFDNAYPLKVDADLIVSDGTHRLGACLYFKCMHICVHRLHRKIRTLGNTDEFWQSLKLPSSFLECLYRKNDDLQRMLIETGHTFALCGPAKILDFSLKIDVQRLCNVLRIETFQDKCFVQFSLPNPVYRIANGRLLSHMAVHLNNILTARYGRDEVHVATSCLEGKEMFDKWRRFSI